MPQYEINISYLVEVLKIIKVTKDLTFSTHFKRSCLAVKPFTKKVLS